MNEVQIVVFPNPVNDVLHIIPSEEIKTIRVYGIDGKLEYASPYAQEYDLSQLKAGLKIVKVELRNSEVKWVRVVKI